MKSPTVVGLFNCYDVHIFQTIQKELPHMPGSKLCMQNALVIHDLCMNCLLKHIYSTQMGIPHL